MVRGRLARHFWMFVTSLMALGCGSESYPVTGTVTFEDGEPVEGARIVFRTRYDGQHMTAFATSDENGQYSLTTWQTDDGAVPGEHVVIVTKPRQPRDIDRRDGALPPPHGREKPGQPGETTASEDLLLPEIHPKFASYDTTPLKFTVGKKENEIDLTVERP